MKVLSFVNQKGGVAKTTSCLNVGAALAVSGKRILLIDLDAQGNLTQSIGCTDLTESQPTVCEVLKGTASAEDAILTTAEDGISILPSDIRLAGSEVELIGAPGRDFLLREALEPLADRYDYALIDCAPSLSILTLMALAAAHEVVIPVAAQYMPLYGIQQLLQTVAVVQKRINPGLKISGVIITLYDGRRGLDKSIVDAIREKFPEEVFSDIVKYNSKIAEAPTFGKSIFAYAPKSSGAAAYAGIASDLIRREEGDRGI